MKTQATINAELAQARSIMATSKNPIDVRMAQVVEYTLCWVLGDRFALQNEVYQLGELLQKDLAP